MEYQVGRKIYEGKIPIPTEAPNEELFMLMMGAVLEDDGNIRCLLCGLPNECCNCGREYEQYP